MKTILFLHGFFASGSCVPANALREAFEGKIRVLTPDIPMHPKEALEFIHQLCDKEGLVLYQNAVARQRDGEVIGKNLYNCHSPKSGEKIRMMMETGMSNSYEVIHHGKHYFVHK